MLLAAALAHYHSELIDVMILWQVKFEHGQNKLEQKLVGVIVHGLM